MKKNDNIDKLFKSKLEEREFDIKPAFLDDLNDRLDAQDSKGGRKRFIYFFAGAVLVLLIALVTTMVLINDDDKQDQIAQQESNASSSDSSEDATRDNLGEDSYGSDSNGSDTSRSYYGSRFGQDGAPQTNLGRDLRDFDKDQKAEDKSSDSGKKATEKEKTAEEARLKAEREAKALADARAKQKAKEAAQREADRIAKVKAEEEAKKKLELEAKEKADRLAEEKRIAEEKATEEAKLLAEKLAEEEEAEKEAREKAEATNSESGDGNELAYNGDKSDTTNTQNSDVAEVEKADSINNEEASTDAANPALPEKKPSTSKWSIQFSTGANYISRGGITGTPESIAIREAQEKNIITPQFNFGVNYNIGKVYGISSGIEFVQHGENLKYEPVIKDTTFISSYTMVVDSMMDTTYIPNYTTNTDTNSVAMLANQNNRHSYVTIPFSISYRMGGPDDKFQATARAGIGVRFLVGGKGNYISNALTGVLEEEDAKITFDYRFSYELAYRFGKTSIFFTPSYHSTFKKFKSMHRYRGLGATFGVKIDL